MVITVKQVFLHFRFVLVIVCVVGGIIVGIVVVIKRVVVRVFLIDITVVPTWLVVMIVIHVVSIFIHIIPIGVGIVIRLIATIDILMLLVPIVVIMVLVVPIVVALVVEVSVAYGVICPETTFSVIAVPIPITTDIVWNVGKLHFAFAIMVVQVFSTGNAPVVTLEFLRVIAKDSHKWLALITVKNVGHAKSCQEIVTWSHIHTIAPLNQQVRHI